MAMLCVVKIPLESYEIVSKILHNSANNLSLV